MIACFGEIMLRFRPDPDYLLLTQAGNFWVEPGGSESNVGIALVNLGHETTMLTGLPDNPLGQKVLCYLRAHDVRTERIIRFEYGRLGLYFTEKGCGSRPSMVSYDRDGSVYNHLGEMVTDLDAWLENCTWLHLSGIALSTSRKAADFALRLTERAYSKGIQVSMDINHRKLLWKWCDYENEYCEYLMKIARRVTLLMGNETDLEIGLFGDPSMNHKDMVARITEISKNGNLAWVAVSQRESEQADRNSFGGIIYDFCHDSDLPKKYETDARIIPQIIDRIGTGDAFCAGIIDGFMREIGPGQTLDRAVMLGTIMHGVSGDASTITNDLLEKCLKDDSGRILR